MRQGLPSPPRPLLQVLAHGHRAPASAAFLQTSLERAANANRFTHAFHLPDERRVGLREFLEGKARSRSGGMDDDVINGRSKLAATPRRPQPDRWTRELLRAVIHLRICPVPFD